MIYKSPYNRYRIVHRQYGSGGGVYVPDKYVIQKRHLFCIWQDAYFDNIKNSYPIYEDTKSALYKIIEAEWFKYNLDNYKDTSLLSINIHLY